MLKNDTLKNGTSRIGLYGSPPGVRSIRENIWTLVFRMDLTSFGPYFKSAVQSFSRMDLTIGQ